MPQSISLQFVHRSNVAHFRRPLTELLEQAFEKKLRNEFWTRELTDFFTDENFQSCAIFQRKYLTKFAIAPESRRLGIAKLLWDQVAESKQQFFLRCRMSNPILPFYLKRATDVVEIDAEWVVLGVNCQLTDAEIGFAKSCVNDFVD